MHQSNDRNDSLYCKLNRLLLLQQLSHVNLKRFAFELLKQFRVNNKLLAGRTRRKASAEALHISLQQYLASVNFKEEALFRDSSERSRTYFTHVQPLALSFSSRPLAGKMMK